MAVKVIASPSQNVDEETDDAKAVDVKLTIGFAPTLIVIPGEIEEQPPPVAVSVVNDSTVTVCPSIRVLVAKTEIVRSSPYRTTINIKSPGLSSRSGKSDSFTTTNSYMSGAATAPTCKPEIGDSLTVICIILLYSSHVAPPYVLIATLL